MSLAPGNRLGPYEIVAAIGAGGMGEVYRARDTRLSRDVAVKILPDSFAADPERVARFQREAHVLASLNHPNIAQIYGLEESDGVRGLVLELVEGPTLADRIAMGTLPLDEALAIAKQIAEALEAAHDQGIIHRDLKPANVKLRPDGVVKVLDFGLAKALGSAETGPYSGSVRLQADFSASPTITSPLMTGQGLILGSAAYMSPEQARGKAVDKRSDVWAFGCVLYEMLTGKRAFEGEEVTDVLAFIITKEPEFAALPAKTPHAIRRLLARCLAKDRKKRLADISDARLEIEEAIAPSKDSVAMTAATPVAPPRRSVVYAAAAGLVGGSAIAGLVAWSLLSTDPAVGRPIQRFTIQLPASSPYLGGNGGQIAISRDGTRLVFPSLEGARRMLFVRDLAQLEAQAIRGSDDAYSPFLSPDGEWVAFFTEVSGSSGKLKKVQVRGGPAITLCDAPAPQGGSWLDDNTIVFSARTRAGSAVGLSRVSAAGGQPVPLTTPDEKSEVRHGWPDVLPGAKGLLMSILPRGSMYDNGAIAVHSLIDGSTRTIIQRAYHARYISSGHIIYASTANDVAAANLMAVPFDIEQLRTTGPHVPVVERIDAGARSIGAAGFGVSPSGVLAYAPAGTAVGARRALVWVDRQGNEELLAAPQRPYVYARLSPDGTRLALDVRDEQNDIWVWDLARQTLTRVTKDPQIDRFPIWTLDGARILYASPRGGSIDNIYSQPADGSGDAQRVFESEVAHSPQAFTRDGHLIIREGGRSGLKLLSLAGKGSATPLLQSPAGEINAELSLDGRWLAYQSDESGRPEIYVRPFPNVNSARVQVSTDGGTRPVWSRDGRELFYLAGQSPAPIAVMAVPLQPGATFVAARPLRVIEGAYFAPPTYIGRSYDVAPDGRRFLVIKPQQTSGESSAPSALVVVLNLLDELKRLAPSTNH